MAPVALRWCLFALLACSIALLLATGLAQADEPEPGPEFTVPIDKATEPVTPEPGACPTVLVAGPYEGEDEAAGQVQELRRELGETCHAIADRLDESVERSWWVVTQLLGQQAASREVNEWLQQGADRDDARNEDLKALAYRITDPGAPALRTTLDGVDVGNPVPVLGVSEGETVESSEATVASIDAFAEAQKVAVWFIAGLLVAAVAGYGIYRAVDRGT